QSADRDLFLLRFAGEGHGASDGRTNRDAAFVRAGAAGGALARMVDSLGLRHGQLPVYLGHGRRKPDVRRYGWGQTGGLAVSTRAHSINRVSRRKEALTCIFHGRFKPAKPCEAGRPYGTRPEPNFRRALRPIQLPKKSGPPRVGC